MYSFTMFPVRQRPTFDNTGSAVGASGAPTTRYVMEGSLPPPNCFLTHENRIYPLFHQDLPVYLQRCALTSSCISLSLIQSNQKPCTNNPNNSDSPNTQVTMSRNNGSYPVSYTIGHGSQSSRLIPNFCSIPIPIPMGTNTSTHQDITRILRATSKLPRPLPPTRRTQGAPP